MNARLAELLTAAHAPAWRSRYGGEFQALLVELPPHPAVVADALGSAAGTHGRALAFAGGAAIALLLVVFAALARVVPTGAELAFEAPVPAPVCSHSALIRLNLSGGVRCPRLG